MKEQRDCMGHSSERERVMESRRVKYTGLLADSVGYELYLGK